MNSPSLHDLRTQYPESWLLEYIEKTKSGEILIGQELMLMLDILLMHLNEPTAVFPCGIRFEMEDAHKRIKFIETHCKHYEAPFAGKPFILTLRQKAFVEALYSFKILDDELGRWVRLFQEALMVVARKCGKALSLDTPIPTPNGWKTMRDIEVGQRVFNENGEPVSVIATSDVFIGHKCYEVEFEDGETIVADADHLWSVMTKGSRKCLSYAPSSERKLIREDYRENDGYFNLSTKDMAHDFARERSDGKGTEYKYRVPMQKAVAYPEQTLPIHPYLLGVWLGDGESGGARISVSRNEVDDFVGRIEESGGKVVSIKQDKSCLRVRISQTNSCLQSDLKSAGLINNKHIPTVYLQSSVEQRRELLRGLMDTDGTCATSGQCEFVQKSKSVVDGFSELLSSLGIKHTVKSKIPTCNGKKCDLVYRVTFFVDKNNSCFKMARKHERLKTCLSPRMLNKSIIDIREVPSVQTKCIAVASPRGLFLAGRSMTVTHNTPFVAALILAEWFCGETGTKALCSSNDYEQADLMFQAINAMREESPTLEKVTRKNVKGLFFGNPKKPKKKGKFSYQNKGNVRKISAKTGAKEGKNIKVGAVDEAHELKDNSSVMPIRQALSTQDEPLYFEITTEGFTADGYLDERLKEARQALKGELERWRWLIWLHTQDSDAEVWQDEKTWVKSNPDLGVIKKWSFLRKMIEEAKTNMETRRFVLAKDFNIKQTDVAAWLQESDILNETAYNLEDFRGCVGLGGVDLSETTDLTCAKMLIMRPGDNKKYIVTKYFIPQSKIDAGTVEDKKDYQKWVNDRLIEVSSGNENDFGLITKWFINLYKQYGIKPYKIGYDNALAKYWVKEMESCGFSMERVNQDKYTMSSPMRLLGDDMRSKLVVYNNNPVDKWCFENTAFQLDSSGRYIMPVKIRDNKNRRIDGCVTTIICYSMYTRYRAEYLSMVR